MPISGRYTGLMTAPLAGSQRLELRVDVDRLGPHAAVMNRVSGDVYDVGNGEETYRESWIVEQPKVVPGSDKTRIDGPVKFWKRPDAPATIRLGISPSGKAEVILTLADGTDEIYECDRSGSEFREVTLEVDVCESVAPLRLPEYDVTSHPDHPGGLVRRTMKLSSAFREAGVAVTILTGPPEVKDGKPEFATWSDAELHHALTSHFKGQRSLWPQWSLWGLLAGSNERGDAGVMFDQVDPDRQGFAVFKSPVFAGLPSGHTSAVEQEVAALRMYLFTWVHEMGHAFNMVHSADKLRSRALSWMNNPINFDGGPREFWGKFPFQFDDKELEHIRHGDMAAVIMGGDPWSFGGHLNVHQDSASRDDAGNSCAEDSPLELLLRGGTDVDFMTPVKIELRLRNLSPRPLRIDARLQCSDGNVTVSIRGRDDKIVEYVPMTHRLRGALLKDLAPAATAEPFLDRYSEELDLTYGRGGFYFDKPGEYVLQATYVGHDRRTVRSNTLRLLIARPDSADETRAQDFFSHDVGKCLYLQGSHSPHLRKGLDVLREAVDRREGTAAGARLAESIAKGIADPFFFRIEKDGNGESERRDKPPDPEAALKFSEPAVAVFQSSTDRTVNLAHGRLARARCDWKRALRRVEEGHRELEIQLSVLEARGVHKSVLDELRSYLNSFFESQS